MYGEHDHGGQRSDIQSLLWFYLGSNSVMLPSTHDYTWVLFSRRQATLLFASFFNLCTTRWDLCMWCVLYAPMVKFSNRL